MKDLNQVIEQIKQNEQTYEKYQLRIKEIVSEISRAHAKLDKELSHLLEEKQELRSKLSKLQKDQSELFTKATQKH